MREFLLGAADESSGGAVERSRWRPDRILPRRALNLIATAAGSGGVALVLMNLFFGPSPTATADEYATTTALASPWPSSWTGSTLAPAPAVAPEATGIGTAQVPATTGSAPASIPQLTATDTRTYAISLPELHGLAEDVPPGTLLELWVLWSDGPTDEARLQRLIRSATLEKIAPGILEGAPPVAILRVAAKDVPDLIWGDQYGTLSAVVRSS